MPFLDSFLKRFYISAIITKHVNNSVPSYKTNCTIAIQLKVTKIQIRTRLFLDQTPHRFAKEASFAIKRINLINCSISSQVTCLKINIRHIGHSLISIVARIYTSDIKLKAIYMIIKGTSKGPVYISFRNTSNWLLTRFCISTIRSLAL